MAVTRTLLSSFRSRSIRVVIACTLSFCLSLLANAESTLELNTHYYDFGPALGILKPSLNYENKLSLDTTVTGRLTVDRVQTGSDVDSVSGASQYAGNTAARTDIRQEYLAGIGHTMGDWKVEGGYVLSVEEDYLSNAPSLVVSRDLFQRNTTLALGYAHNFDQVKGIYMSNSKSKNVDNVSFALTQILSRSSLIQAGYTMQYNYGFLSTGNRQIVLENDAIYDEYLPGTRLRQAIGIRYGKWFPSHTTLRLGYRFYTDDWGLNSQTAQMHIYQKLSDALTLRAEYRYYTQTGVSFAKDIYNGTEKYLTSANSLRAFDSHLFGLKLVYQPRWMGEDWKLESKLEQYTQSTGLSGRLLMLSISKLY